MKQENYEITVKRNGEIIDQKETGKMYDGWIKACEIREDFQEKYDDCVVEVKKC